MDTLLFSHEGLGFMNLVDIYCVIGILCSSQTHHLVWSRPLLLSCIYWLPQPCGFISSGIWYASIPPTYYFISIWVLPSRFFFFFFIPPPPLRSQPYVGSFAYLASQFAPKIRFGNGIFMFSWRKMQYVLQCPNQGLVQTVNSSVR